MTYTKNETGKRMAHSAISKFLATVLSAALVFVSIPVYAFAADPVQTPESYDDLVHDVITEQATPADALDELVARRTENDKYIRMADGAETVVRYPFDVHFADGDGFSEYDNTLILKENLYLPTNSDMKIAFSANTENGLFSYGKDGYTVSVSMPETNSVQAKLIDKEPYKAENLYDKITVLDRVTAGISYEDVLPGVNLTYTLYGHDVKEEITLLSRPEVPEFSFILSAGEVKAELAEDGGILLSDADGNTVFSIPAGYMTDAKGDRSDSVVYKLSACEEGSVLSVIPDADWLNDENRAYPVTIDPSFMLGGYGTSMVTDASVMEGNPNASTAGNHMLYIGYSSAASSLRMRSYLKINSFPTLPDSAAIISATLNLEQVPYGAWYSYSGTQNYLNITAKEVTSSWTESVTWNTKPSNSSKVLDYCTMTAATARCVFYLDITSAVQKWIKIPSSNYGVVLQTENESANGYVSVISSDDPYTYSVIAPMFSINYRDTKGLEDRWSYSTQNVGNAGTGYVNLYDGNLVFVHNDISSVGNILPVSISHVYNAYQKKNQFQPHGNNVNAPLTADFKANYGYGWKLSIEESVVPKTLGDGSNWLVWNDADGTENYFYDYNDGISGNYLSEDGFSLKITVNSSSTSAKYVMSDDNGNKKTFDSEGRLREIEDKNGNKKQLYYNGEGHLSSLKEKSASETSFSTIFTFFYNDNHGLKQITNLLDTNNYLKFYYSSTYNGAISADNTNYLRKIEYYYNNTLYNSCSYTYTSDDYLYEAIDNSTGAKICYTTTDKKVSTVSEYGSASAAGQKVGYTYADNKTAVRTSGLDDVYENSDDINTVYVFDNYGRANTVYSADLNGNELYGVGNASYNENVPVTEGSPKRNNTISESASSGYYPANLVNNGNAESLTGWSTHVDTGYSVASSSVSRYLGSYSFVITSSRNTGYGEYTQIVNIPSAGTYTLSAYVKADQVTSAADGAYLMLDTVQSEKLTGTTNTAIHNGWERLSVTKTFTASCNCTVRLRLAGATGTAYFDCIQLEKADAPSAFNLIDNGTFSANRTWSTSYGASYTTGFLGNGISMTSTPSASRYTSQAVQVQKQGTAFVLSGWAKADSVSLTDEAVNPGNSSYAHTQRYMNMQAYIHYTDGTSERQYVYFNPDIKNEWQFASGVILPNAEKTVTYLTVFLDYSHNCNTVVFDNISLTEENVSSYEYDANGNVTAIASTSGESESLAYTGTNLTSVQSAAGERYTYTYDSVNNLLSATSRVGVKASYTYDSCGNVTQTVISPAIASINKRITTQNTYTTDGNYLIKTTDALGHETDYNYNTAKGLLNYIKDANNNRTAYIYDHAGKLTDIYLDKNTNSVFDTDDDNEETGVHYVYNAQEQLIEIVTKSTTYHFAYDAFGNLLNIKVGDSTTPLVSYTYASQNGKLLSTTYADGTTVTNIYDALDRIKSVKYNNDTAYTITYDGNGNISSYTDDAGRVYLYEYDSTNRLVRYTVKQNGVNLLRSENQYDSAGRQTQTAYAADGNTFTTGIGYDANGRISTVTTGSDSITLSYDYFERINGRNFRHSGNSMLFYSETYSYTTNGTKTSTQVSQKQYKDYNGTSFKTYAYTYDSLGNILTENDGTDTKVYTYDELNQLTSETVYANSTGIGTKTTWAYDKAGNITQKQTYSYNNGSTSLQSTLYYGYTDSNWGDKLTSYDGHTITYDANGNPISYYNGQSYTFTWQKGRQLASAVKGGVTSAYTYDGNGIRATKTVGGVTHTYVTKGSRIIKETWGSQYLLYFYDENGAVDGIEYYNGTSAQKYYFLKNLQGDVVTMRDENNTTVVNYAYDAWGKLLSVTDASGNAIISATHIANINPIRYRGYYYDTETGLYYLQTRFYDPQTGRFINADGQLNDGLLGFNLFAYCGNNPVNCIDPTGQAWWHWALGAAVVAACAVATVVTCGGFAGAALAVCMVVNGTAAVTATATVAAGAFIASSTALGMVALDAAFNSSSVDEFMDQGNWWTVARVAFAGARGAYSGYQMYRVQTPNSVSDKQCNGNNAKNYNLNGSKDANYVNKRGWNDKSINAAINNGRMGTSINKATNQPCTVYCYPGTNSYVVIENSSRSLVQASQFGDMNWIPDNTIIWDS